MGIFESLRFLFIINLLFITKLEEKQVVITCYQSTYEQTGSYKNITASGKKIEDPANGSKYCWAASSPDLGLPFGTRVYIKELDRVVEIQDRTSRRISNTIDILEDYGKRYKFKQKVIILKKSINRK